jgi:2-hydroxycyclohexanecarboxyl-CoA dehydrogenase
VSERVAFVTGGARGIGRAIALALAADGRAVAVADMRADAARETAAEIGPRSLALSVDVTDSQAVAAGVREAESELGPIGVLVNNAGWDELHPFVETDEAFWDRIVDVNYKGCLRVTRAVLPGMLERGWGRIVNVSSDAARVGSSGEAVYAGAKGAVISFTKTIARESARRGVTANVVCPGPTATPLMDEMLGAGGERLMDAMVRAVPMRRLAEPEEIAHAVAFLASDGAGYITGQTLSVSGGLTMA